MHLFPANNIHEFLTLIIICLPIVVVSLCKTHVIVNFGDSNSDTGGMVAGLGLEFGYPYGRAFSNGRPTGRASDGRLVIDFLCENLHTKYLSPYLDSLEPNFTNGVNFAVGGAATLPKFINFNLNIQVLQFKRFYNLSLDLYTKGNTNLLGKEDFDNALYTIDIGQNDLSGSFVSLPYAQVIEKIPSFIFEIKDAMLAIYEHGGKNFWVHNTGPLGCLPQELAIRYKLNSSDYDKYGCIKSLNKGARAFNAKLNSMCKELRSRMKNSKIVYVDVYSIKYELISNSKSYGFKNPLIACCGYGGAPYNYNPDFNKTCFGTRYDVCDERTMYLSWDGTHYTEAANAIIASKINSTLYSSPPLDFDFFCKDVGHS